MLAVFLADAVLVKLTRRPEGVFGEEWIKEGNIGEGEFERIILSLKA
jgi:hypothetical protein